VPAIVKLDDIWLDDYLEQSCEHIDTKVTPEVPHNPEKLGQLQKQTR
jgi:hypothetical protein